MSRHGYSDCTDEITWSLIRWRGAVNSAIKGKRGQAFLRELADALDSMPDKRLIEEYLVDADGEVCAIGAACKARGVAVNGVNPEDYDAIAKLAGIAPAMAREIMYENDEEWGEETPEQRWARMRWWVEKQIIKEPRP